MKTFYWITGVVFIIGCFFFLKTNYKKLETYQKGYFVNATVVFVPDCITTKSHYYIKFNYNGRIYAKEIGVLSCRELNEGEIIRLKTNQENSFFLYENENPYNDTVAFVVLFFFGVFLIYKGVKK